MAGVVWRHGYLDDQPHEGVGTGECPAQEDVCRGTAEGRNPQGGHGKKVVRPSRRREMAKQTVSVKGVPIRLACDLFSLSETCYRYEARKDAENEQIADWLIRLTADQRNWGFGLCCLYLRNVKGFG